MMLVFCVPCRCTVSSSSRSIETKTTKRRSVFNSSCRSSNIRVGSVTRSTFRGNLSFGKTRRPTRRAVVPEEYASSAIPPANEIAGFVVGFLMLYVVVQASKLDAIIAEAQARGLARKRDEEEDGFGDKKWMSFSALDEKDATVERVKRGKGNVFILPPESTSDATKE